MQQEQREHAALPGAAEPNPSVPVADLKRSQDQKIEPLVQRTKLATVPDPSKGGADGSGDGPLARSQPRIADLLAVQWTLAAAGPKYRSGPSPTHSESG